jgi:hypothetical protein
MARSTGSATGKECEWCGLSELDHVAEQHQAVVRPDGFDQKFERLRQREHTDAAPLTEVHV